jgi:tetratricopeptide (TPR) repeat protein
LGCEQASTCASNLAQLAEMELSRGNLQRGLALYKQAQDRDPERADLLERYASVAAGAQLHAQAHDAYKRLAARYPDRPDYADKAAQHRAAMQTRVYGDKVPKAP